ncbi:WD repeat-containing protein 5B-like [Watersipora subatra]|uniref:WD repeat-containing protein 5B-like n=1 Tax=Watersipora subatra TaxID=2589382 RepID=UPI00355C91A0
MCQYLIWGTNLRFSTVFQIYTMFALDYMSNGRTVGITDGLQAAQSSNTKPVTRTRSNSMTSSVSDGARLRPPHTEGHIKWLTTVDCGAEVMCTKFSSDGSLFAVGLSTGNIKIFQADGTLVYSLHDSDVLKMRLPCTSIQFVPHRAVDSEDKSNILVATYASGFIKFWHYPSGQCLNTIIESKQSSRQCLCSSLTLTGERMAIGGADPAINVYDTVTKKKVVTLEPSDSRDVMNGHRLRVFAVQYHPNDTHMLISGGWDDTIQFWDDRTPHAVRRIYGPHICGDALDIDGVHNHVITGSWRKNNVLQIWDIASGSKIKDVPQDALHKCMLYCCQWLGKDYIICGGNEQNMARIIDRGTLNTVAQVVDLEQGVYSIDNDRQGGLPKLVIGAAHNVYLMKQEKRV